MDPNVFQTANAGFAQAMYEEYLREPGAVAPEWRRLFESGVIGEGNGVPEAGQRGGGAAGQVNTGLTEQRAVQAAPLPRSPAAEPIKGPAAKLVANMTESLSVPTATTFRVLPVALLEDRRGALNSAIQVAGKSGKISFTHLIAYAIVQAAKQQPAMAQTFAVIDGTPHRVQPDGIGLGLAVDVQRKDGSRGL
ncbi:MAG TPA: 2-oxo acid dehydrogenase subunit E2, partial [Gemmatimonadales bacterium]|nr:2-oxo acid dehydrogenase subunit E2 [Gemmatimonadales bacterium]